MNRNVSILEEQHNFALQKDVKFRIVFVAFSVKEPIRKLVSTWITKNLYMKCIKDKD